MHNYVIPIIPLLMLYGHQTWLIEISQWGQPASLRLWQWGQPWTEKRGVCLLCLLHPWFPHTWLLEIDSLTYLRWPFHCFSCYRKTKQDTYKCLLTMLFEYVSQKTVKLNCDHCVCIIMAWYDVTWRDMMWHDVTMYGVPWHDMTWCDMTWHDMIWRDMTWRSVAWCDVTGHDVTWHDVTTSFVTNVTWSDGRDGHDVTWREVSWRDITWYDVTWRDLTWHDVTRFGISG